MAKQIVSVPDIGGAEGVEVIEISVAVNDQVEQDQDIVTLETDKATMDIPCSVAGVVTEVFIATGDKVSQGSALIEVEVEGASEEASVTPEPAEEAASNNDGGAASENKSPAAGTSEETVIVPDGAEDADVIEVCVSVGDTVEEGDSLIVLETDKASMEIPSPKAGVVVSIAVNQGDKTVAGGEIAVITVERVSASEESAFPKAQAPQQPTETQSASDENSAPAPLSTPSTATSLTSAPSVIDEQAIFKASQSKEVYAGPAVRKFAREMAIDLTLVPATGERGRVVKDDIKAYVKNIMTGQQPSPVAASGGMVGSGIPPISAVDFSKFGEIELLPMSKIKKLTAENMSRNWLNIPHVTQFDDADITDLEAFRKGLKAEAERRGVKLTPLPFLLKACAAALVAEPSFNVSLHHDGEHIVQKHYVNIGVAVDSPVGLVVPVIRDVDKKGLWELAAEFIEVIDKARNGKLTVADMQGGCFTISSLGAMGGQGFTPIVNAPEVAILGVSKAEIKPKWNGSEFEPRNMLPLSLSYDHRAINGGDAGRFFVYLNSVIADVRRLLL